MVPPPNLILQCALRALPRCSYRPCAYHFQYVMQVPRNFLCFLTQLAVGSMGSVFTVLGFIVELECLACFLVHSRPIINVCECMHECMNESFLKKLNMQYREINNLYTCLFHEIFRWQFEKLDTWSLVSLYGTNQNHFCLSGCEKVEDRAGSRYCYYCYQQRQEQQGQLSQ